MTAVICVFLVGCNSIDTMKSNAEEVVSKITEQSSSSQEGITLGESTSSTSNTGDKLITSEYGVDASAYGIYAKVTDVAMSTTPNKVSIKFTVGDKFSVEESLVYTEVETDNKKESGESEVKTEVSSEFVIRVGTIGDVNKVFDYLNRPTFEEVVFDNRDNIYTAVLSKPYALNGAPRASYIDSKIYCEEIHRKMREAIDDSKRIKDGATGIVYNSIGGNEFNLVKYRYQVRRGETVQIEIQDIPDGYTAQDVTFHSDKVGYARVSGDGTITGVNNGSATVTVSLRGAAVYRTVYVQVY